MTTASKKSLAQPTLLSLWRRAASATDSSAVALVRTAALASVVIDEDGDSALRDVASAAQPADELVNAATDQTGGDVSAMDDEAQSDAISNGDAAESCAVDNAAELDDGAGGTSAAVKVTVECEEQLDEHSDSNDEESEADGDGDEDFEVDDEEESEEEDDEDEPEDEELDADRIEDEDELLAISPKKAARTNCKKASNRSQSSSHEFQCAVATCGAAFTKKDHLTRHMGRFHEVRDDREYTCDLCEMQFPTRHEKELHDHEVSHDRFLCKVPNCGKSYSKREHLNRHVLTSHTTSETTEKQFRCEICDIGFAYSHGLVRHKNRSHVNQNKPYECAQCLLAFKKKSDLQAHSYVHTGVLPFECDVCQARFAKRFQLVRHERSHSGSKKAQAQVIFCEENGCGEMLFTTEDKAQHDRDVHHKATPTKKEKSEKKPSKCKKRKRVESVPSDAEADAEANRKAVLVCQVCGHSFLRKQALRAHLRTHFEAVNERKMHMCPMDGCENTYTRKSNLMAHYNAVHDAVRSQRFVCPFKGCEGKFGYKKVLNTHMDSVHLNPTPAKKRKVKATSARARALGMTDEQSSDVVVIADGRTPRKLEL